MEPYLRTKRSKSDRTRKTSQWTDPATQPAPTIVEGQDAWNDSVSGWKNPGWRSKVRNHQGATTQMSGNYQKVFGSPDAYAYLDFISNPPNPSQTHRRNYGMVYLGSGFASPTSLSITAASNAALVNFYQDARKQMTALYAGTVLGEMKEALSMIIHPAKSFRKRVAEYQRYASLRARRIYRKRGKDEANRFVANTWLEYSFGMRPLMADVRAGAEAFNENINRYKGSYARCRGYAKVEAPIPLGGDPTFLQVPVDRIQYICNRRATATAETRYLGLVSLEFDNPLAFRMELFGFNLSSFVPTVWELIPYSWMVDYFSNIGGVMSAWTFPLDRIKWVNTTHRLSRSLEVKGTLRPPSEFIGSSAKIVSTYGQPLDYASVARRVEREPGNPGWPTIGFQVPGLSTKWINLFALGRARRVTGLSVR